MPPESTSLPSFGGGVHLTLDEDFEDADVLRSTISSSSVHWSYWQLAARRA